MISFESVVTSIIGLILFYGPFCMSEFDKKKSNPKHPLKRHIIFASVIFFLFLFFVLGLYFWDVTSRIWATIVQILNPIFYKIKIISHLIFPFWGSTFVLKYFSLLYYIGWSILLFGHMFLLYGLFHNKYFFLAISMSAVIVFTAWIEYFIANMVYIVFIEFSFLHTLFFSVILNFSILYKLHKVISK